MSSWRTSLSLDVIADHDLIEKLVGLQAEGKASEEIRTALREHFGMQVTLNDVMAKLTALEDRLTNVSLQSSVVRESETTSVQAASDELERRLEKTLGRFRRVDGKR